MSLTPSFSMLELHKVRSLTPIGSQVRWGLWELAGPSRQGQAPSTRLPTQGSSSILEILLSTQTLGGLGVSDHVPRVRERPGRKETPTQAQEEP